MLITFITCLYFGICMAIKGGWHKKIKRLNKLSESGILYHTVLDGRWLSTSLVFLYALPFVDAYTASMCAIGWFLGIVDSMGEEAGAIGGYGEYTKWMPEKKNIKILGIEFSYIEGQLYGIKKAMQRGAWFGVPLAVLTLYTGWIIAGLMFVPSYFLGIKARQIFTKRNDWDWAELLFGICLGIAFDNYVHGFLG